MIIKSYNIALCFYQLRQYAQALKHIADIIERGIKEHPELSVGLTTEGIDVRSVGNTHLLHQTALIEAFNLKAAIEYQLRNLEAASEAMTDMPPRAEEELDPGPAFKSCESFTLFPLTSFFWVNIFFWSSHTTELDKW